MTLARAKRFDAAVAPYCHCISRCVRRTLRCGQDPVTGRDSEHRRGWIEQRLHELAGIFAIDLCAYAVMSNHYYVVLHLNTAKLASWDEQDALEHWQRLYRLQDGVEAADWAVPRRLVAVWRQRPGS